MLRWRIPALALAVILVNLPYLLLRYMRDYAPNNEIQTHVQATFRLAGSLTIINPVVFFSIAGPLALIAFLSAGILWRRSREDLNLRLLLCGVIGIYAVVFNPLLVPLLASKISYLLLRFEFAIPSSIVAAYLLDALMKKARGGMSSLSRSAAALGWIVFGASIAYAAVETVTHFAYGDTALREARRMNCRSLSGLYDAVNRNIPPGSVIASDPVTSYCIPAFTDQFVVCTYDQHSIPNDSTALERILACREIYLPDASLDDVASALRRYGAGYIVLNGKLPQEISALYWRPGRRSAEEAFARLSAAPACFDLLYREGDVSLFRFIDSPGGFPGPVARNTLGSGRALLTENDAAALPPAGVPGIRIGGIHASPAPVRRGDTLRIVIDWVAERRSEPRSYVALLRFDTGLGRAPLYHASYGKLYRKAYELVRGRRYRFSASHLPLGGVYPPDKWEPFRMIADTVGVPIPTDISPGIYTISVKMAPQAHYPNYTIKDILTDNDLYQGVPLERVEIQ